MWWLKDGHRYMDIPTPKGKGLNIRFCDHWSTSALYLVDVILAFIGQKVCK